MSLGPSLLPVVQVVVHPDGALVTRAGPLPVAEGRVVVRGLPLVLDPTSLRAHLSGIGVAELRAEIELLDDDGVEAPRRVEELRAARDELAAVDAEIAASGELRETLSGLAPGFDEDDARRVVPAPERLTAWLAADRALGLRVEALDETVRALGARRRDLAERIERLTHEVTRSSTEERWARWVPTRRVVLRTDGEGAGPVQVELSYRVPGAQWSPAYVLDADDALRQGRFSMRAIVQQATGEDWRGVRLTLASGPCERRIDVPDLPALRLGALQPAPSTGWRPLPTDLDSLFPNLYELGAAQPEPPRKPEPAGSRQGAPPLGSRQGAPPLAPRERSTDDDVDLEPSPDDDDLSASLEPVLATPAPIPRASAPPQRPSSSSTRVELGVPEPMGRARGIAAAAPVTRGPKGGAERSRREAPASGGGGPRQDEPEAALEVDQDWLDYGRMRLATWSAAPGERGRLRPASDEDVLVERGAPAVARARLASRLLEARREVAMVSDRALPPHHVVPGPVSGTDVRIDARGTVDVPADGRIHSVAVEAWPAAFEVAYRAVPRSDPRAFRRVTARIEYDRALLPGPVDVYVEGKLEITSPWPGSPGRGVLEIGLGAEDRLKLVRNVRYSETSAGMFGGSRRLHTEIEVKVASSLARAVSIELLERVPVPADGKDVAVEQTEASPVAEPYKGEPDAPILEGGRRQVLEIAPGGEARAVLAYALTIGAKEEIAGGDRRG